MEKKDFKELIDYLKQTSSDSVKSFRSGKKKEESEIDLKIRRSQAIGRITICEHVLEELKNIFKKHKKKEKPKVKAFYCRQQKTGRRDDTCSEQCDSCVLQERK
jgi:rRNA-processing protein FCF1